MESDYRVSKVSVKSHSRCESNGHVCEQAHAKRGQGRDGSGSGNKITLDFLDTEGVFGVGIAHRVIWEPGADAGTTTVGHNGCCTWLLDAIFFPSAPYDCEHTVH